MAVPQPMAVSQPNFSIAVKRRRDDAADAAAYAASETEDSVPRKRSKCYIQDRCTVEADREGYWQRRPPCPEDSRRNRATIKIADAIARHEERVIIISSKESDNIVSDSQNVLKQIASLILKEDDIPVGRQNLLLQTR